jgi:hypothetical protein
VNLTRWSFVSARFSRPVSVASLTLLAASALGAENPPPTSFAPVVMTEDFASVMQRMSAAKPQVLQRQKDLLSARYDLADRPRAASRWREASRCRPAFV